MSYFFLVKAILLVIMLGFALFYDLTEGKIKNKLTLPVAGVGLVLNYLDSGSAGLTAAFLGWLVPILVLFIFYYLQVMGAGDIKLFAAIGALMGLSFATYSFVFTIYIGGGIAVVLLLKRKQLLQRFRYFFLYTKLLLLTRKLSVYRSADDLTSTFVFATAIVPGTLMQLVRSVLEIKGVGLGG